MRMLVVWMASVGRDEYNVDEDDGEDDTGRKDNCVKDAVRRPTCFVRLLAQLSN